MTTNDKILNGSGLSTVLGLVKNKIDLKQDAPLIGTTENTTPTQVANAMAAGKDVFIETTQTFLTYNETFLFKFNAYGKVVSNMVGASGLFKYVGLVYAMQLTGWLSDDTWSWQVTEMAKASDIPSIPTDVSAFTNDAGYLTTTSLTPYVKVETTNPSGYLNNKIVHSNYNGNVINGGIAISSGSSNVSDKRAVVSVNSQYERGSTTTSANISADRVSITGVITPESDTMAANKKYVDDAITSTVADALTPYVAKSEVLPVQGITGPVIATIGGVTIHAPFAEGGVTQETDPIFTQSAAYGITSTDISNWNAKSDFSGSYNDLTDTPTIPTAVSQLTNDSNFIPYGGVTVTRPDSMPDSNLFGIAVVDGKTIVIPRDSTKSIGRDGDNTRYIITSLNNVTYTVPAYTTTITHNNQVTTKKYVDDSITDAVTTAISGITSISFDTSYTTYAEMSAQTGEAGVIYLIPNSGTTPNIYDEYIYANNSYEKIGTTEVDLSNYVQTEDIADFITATSLTPYLQKSGISVAQGLTTGIEIGSISIDSVTTALYAPSAAEGFHKVVLSENSGVYSITSSGDTFASIKQRLDNNQVVYVTISGDSTIYHINSIDSSELTFRNISNTTWKNISITSASVTVTDISISQNNSILEIK